MEPTAPVEIQAEMTPNPNTLKFIVDRPVLESGTANFPDRAKASYSPLATRLFEMKEITGVLIGTDFVTVTKTPEVEWPALVYPVVDRLRAFFSSGEEAVSKAFLDTRTGPLLPQTETEKKILEILELEIRPAVARDGGDISFHGFENGVVKLHLEGSCSSCPSSIMTLKMGIENRLRQAVPEVREVQQV